MLDKTSFGDFAKRFDITKGVLIGDKGFELTDEKRKEIAKHTGLKYLIPIKRNLKCIQDYGLQNYDDVLETVESAVLCKKTKVFDSLYYYAFLDLYLQGTESKGYVSKAKSKLNKDNTVEDLLAKYAEKKDSFGTIIFESNMDVSCEDAYEMYSYRWSVEEIFRYYKNVLGIDNVKVQDDTRLWGSEFINFIATLITCKIWNYLVSRNINKNYSFHQVMTYLSKIKKCRNIDAPETWYPVVSLKYIKELFNQLDLSV